MLRLLLVCVFVLIKKNYFSRQAVQPTNTQASPPRPSTLLISEPKPVPTSARKLARASSPTKVSRRIVSNL